ncbi:MAG: O-antigen ligase family protein [Anaerolineae bacterium]|nr:O-antigen ligase family protein [Anaerolineae bacterium]
MLKRSDFLARMLVTLLFTYALSLGATFNGILNAQFAPITLIIMALCVVGWLWIRQRRGWQWHRTALDWTMLLWVVAFGVSLLGNPDAARRIAIGLWYVGVYIGVWYVLHDMIANGALKRETLVDGLLISGLVVLIFGYVQLQFWVREVLASGLGAVSLPRPVSTFGNPNFLGGFLVVLIPLVLSRAFLTRVRFNRIMLLLYAGLAFVLLFLTFSRGAWIGTAVGCAIWGLLLLAQHNLLSPSQLKAWWSKQSRLVRGGVVAVSSVVLIGTAVAGVIVVRSFSDSARSAGLRTELYQAAVELFIEKPITGQGLFTYGRGLVRLPDIQPDKPHSHAHNAPLHIAAELGLVGLAALAVTLWLTVRAMRSNWRAMSARDRTLLAGAIGAVVAFAVHQLTDVPAMMPAIALTGLVGLVVAVAPQFYLTPQPPLRTREGEKAIQSDRVNRLGKIAQRVAVMGMAVLWVGLVVTGLWSNGVYANSVAAMRYAVETNDYWAAAQRMQPVIEADPNLSLYHLEQGFLLGMAASEGDTQAAQDAVAAYERFIALDPGYALGWANLAGLKWQLGEQQTAIEAMERAAELNARDWRLRLNLALFYEAAGNLEAANMAYDRILREYPDASLYPEFDTLAARLMISSQTLKLTVYAQMARLLESGEVDAAVALWADHPQPRTAQTTVLNALLALAQDERDAAVDWLEQAARLGSTAKDSAWIHLGMARLAAFDGDAAGAAQYQAAAYAALERGALDGDDEASLNIAYAQFLRLTIPRQYLPQVAYPVDDPVLLYLLGE